MKVNQLLLVKTDVKDVKHCYKTSSEIIWLLTVPCLWGQLQGGLSFCCVSAPLK